jgi:hypothetical protein
MRGRPSIFSPELAALLCERLAGGETLRAICRDEGMPDERTVRRWALDDVEGFSGPYAKAREIGYQSLADELLKLPTIWAANGDAIGSASIPANGCSPRRSPRSTATSSRSSIVAPYPLATSSPLSVRDSRKRRPLKTAAKARPRATARLGPAPSSMSEADAARGFGLVPSSLNAGCSHRHWLPRRLPNRPETL